MLSNHSTDDYHISICDCIAQMIIMEVPPSTIEEAQHLSLTERGAGGFGSTEVSTSTTKQLQINVMYTYYNNLQG